MKKDMQTSLEYPLHILPRLPLHHPQRFGEPSQMMRCWPIQADHSGHDCPNNRSQGIQISMGGQDTHEDTISSPFILEWITNMKSRIPNCFIPVSATEARNLEPFFSACLMSPTIESQCAGKGRVKHTIVEPRQERHSQSIQWRGLTLCLFQRPSDLVQWMPKLVYNEQGTQLFQGMLQRIAWPSY